jgi:predicted nuclease of restriction endonuclease-like (RecB) superfamily
MRSFAEGWPEKQIVQQFVALLPWGHHMVLLDRVKDAVLREWNLLAAVEYGWSRNVTVLQIKSGLHEREGKALTNFHWALPPPPTQTSRNRF